ncbi:MAG: cytochrome b [Burkholderiales bacterium]
MKNPAVAYSRTAIILHWLSALMIFASVALGLSMVDLPLSPKKLQWYSWHKWMGVTIFMLIALRLLWRSGNPVPPLPAMMPRWQKIAAHVTHWVLYALLLLIPLSGWFRSAAAGVQVVYLGVLPLPNPIGVDKPLGEQLKLLHQALNYMMLALVFTHVVAALKHQLIDKDDILARMIPFLRPK